MPTIETVTGPIDADGLGRTLVHEHLRFRDEAMAAQWPHAYDEQDELRAATDAVRAAMEHGVRTIVDPAPMFGGRDVRFLRRVAEATGVQLVTCTGIYSYDPLPRWFDLRDADAVADLYVHDLRVGVQGTDVKAAFIKCAADEPGITPNVEKLHRAAARASMRTGAPIMAHTRPASDTAPRQLEILQEEGVDLGKVHLAHCGDTADVEAIEALLERGAFAGLDRFGLEMFLPLDQRNATAAELLRRGHAERLMLGQDFCATIDWVPQAVAEQLLAHGAVRADWSMTLIFEQVIPWLREQGVWDDAVERQVLEVNPRAWLTA